MLAALLVGIGGGRSSLQPRSFAAFRVNTDNNFEQVWQATKEKNNKKNACMPTCIHTCRHKGIEYIPHEGACLKLRRLEGFGAWFGGDLQAWRPSLTKWFVFSENEGLESMEYKCDSRRT